MRLNNLIMKLVTLKEQGNVDVYFRDYEGNDYPILDVRAGTIDRGIYIQEQDTDGSYDEPIVVLQ